jgi:hypothetical protein
MHNKGRIRHNNGSSKGHYQYSNGNLENYQNDFWQICISFIYMLFEGINEKFLIDVKKYLAFKHAKELEWTLGPIQG